MVAGSRRAHVRGAAVGPPNPRPPNAVKLWAGVLALWAVLAVSQLFYSHPPAWPDEATFGDTAYSLSIGRGFAAPSLTGQVPGAEHHLAWEPPLHTVAVAAAFTLAGPGVAAMRVVSLVCAALLLFAVWRISGRMAGPLTAIMAITLLLVDARFLRGAIIGRGDGMAMALAFLAIWRGGSTWGGLLAGLALSRGDPRVFTEMIYLPGRKLSVAVQINTSDARAIGTTPLRIAYALAEAVK